MQNELKYDSLSLIFLHFQIRAVDTCHFSNHCFGDVRHRLHDEIKSLRDETGDEDETAKVEELDIGRPIITYAKKTSENILTDQLRILAEVFESTDFLAKEHLLKLGLVDCLMLLRDRYESYIQRIIIWWYLEAYE